jgi:hypothetical protein
MSLSTVVVAVNAMLLRRLDLQPARQTPESPDVPRVGELTSKGAR